MDGDLFQIILLGLIALGLIIGVALLATLGGVRRALEERASQTASEPPVDLTPDAEQAAPAGEVAAAEAGSTSTASTTTGSEADTIRGVLERHGLQGGQAAAAPSTAADAAAYEPAVSQEVGREQTADSVFAAHADDPQEEPFQRDGRWWFRRGDELLLYDEASGQWQPSPGDAPGAGAASAGTPGTPATETHPVATQAQATPAVADQVATYWKCPTCGAVNGSTAATCRMCFAARP